jgi:hypothetical protein
VRSDVYEGSDMGVGASLGDDGPAVALTNQDARALLAIKDRFGRGDILLQRGQRQGSQIFWRTEERWKWHSELPATPTAGQRSFTIAGVRKS